IQTDVSTRTTTQLPVDAAILPDDRQLPFPQPGPGQLEDPAGLGATDEVFERALDRTRVGPFAAQSRSLLQQVLVQHKICPFHTHREYNPVRLVSSRTPAARRSPRLNRPETPAP